MRRRSTQIYATMHGTSAKTWNSPKILLSGTWVLTPAIRAIQLAGRGWQGHERMLA